MDLRPCPTVDQYVAAIHFAMTTMATVGYGDVAPKTRIERLVAMIIMAIGETSDWLVKHTALDRRGFNTVP